MDESEEDKLKESETKAADAPADDKPAGKPEDAPRPDEAGPGDDESDDEDDRPVPAGAAALAAVHKSLCGAARKCMKQADRIEQPDVKGHLKSLGDSLMGHAEETRDCHAKCYKDLKPLAMDQKDDDSDGDAVEKFLSDSANERLPLRAQMFKFRGLLTEKNLTVGQKSVIEALAGTIEKTIEAATKRKTVPSPVAKVESGGDAEITKAIVELANEFRGIKKSLEDAVPHRHAS